MSAPLHPLLQQLAGGDRRSIGQSPAVVQQVLLAPDQFGLLIDGMAHPDAVIRMRCADAAEKVSAVHPQLLVPFARQLLGPLAASTQPEVRWHLAPMLARLPLNPAQRRRAVAILRGYCSDRSSIVKTQALQALVDLALQYPALRPAVAEFVTPLLQTGTPAMQARGRRLLRQLAQATTEARAGGG